MAVTDDVRLSLRPKLESVLSHITGVEDCSHDQARRWRHLVDVLQVGASFAEL